MAYRDVVVEAHAPAAGVHQSIEGGQLAASGHLLGRVLAVDAQVIDGDRSQSWRSYRRVSTPRSLTGTGLSPGGHTDEYRRPGH